MRTVLGSATDLLDGVDQFTSVCASVSYIVLGKELSLAMCLYSALDSVALILL